MISESITYLITELIIKLITELDSEIDYKIDCKIGFWFKNCLLCQQSRSNKFVTSGVLYTCTQAHTYTHTHTHTHTHTSNACFKSSTMSSASSIPTDNRIYTTTAQHEYKQYYSILHVCTSTCKWKEGEGEGREIKREREIERRQMLDFEEQHIHTIGREILDSSIFRILNLCLDLIFVQYSMCAYIAAQHKNFHYFGFNFCQFTKINPYEKKQPYSNSILWLPQCQ